MRERFGEEDELGILRAQLGEAPAPEGERFGVRVVDTEDAHAARHPEFEDALQFEPESPPILALEIEWIDVLILLRRVLRVADVAVRAMAEPTGVLLHVGVIRRHLK